MERPISRKLDWQLGAAFLAAPFYWWMLSLTSDTADAASGATIRQLLLVGLIYPVLEEVVFRGVVQGWLRKQSWGLQGRFGITAANVVTSAVFAVAHVLRRQDIMSAGVFIPGLIFGYFRDRYDSLYAPIALHVFYNAGLVLLFW